MQIRARNVEKWESYLSLIGNGCRSYVAKAREKLQYCFPTKHNKIQHKLRLEQGWPASPFFVVRGRFSECKGMWPAQACHRSFFSKFKKLKRNENWKERGAKNKKIHFLDLWGNNTSSRALLLTVTPICCFATSLARADPRGISPSLQWWESDFSWYLMLHSSK